MLVFEIQNTKYFQSFVINTEIQNTKYFHVLRTNTNTKYNCLTNTVFQIKVNFKYMPALPI